MMAAGRQALRFGRKRSSAMAFAENSAGLMMAPLRLHNRNGAIKKAGHPKVECNASATRSPFSYSLGSYTAAQEITTVTWS